MIRYRPFVLAFLLILICSNLVNAQVVLPTGFNQVLVATGIIGPTTMAIAPDGRFFIAQQNGILKVLKHDTLLAQPFITLSVNTNGERGLLGIAFDPAFTTNHFVYLCYTVSSGTFNRVSRFTANGDVVVPGSEVVIMTLDTLIANYHTGGHLDFGPDGKLYIATGENGRPTRAQNIDTYLGKILRINSDGSVPADNPFPGPGKRQRVWAYGMRNPFTFSFQPGTGRLFVNDVGEVTYEEIDDVTIGGGNFGWPNAEGFSNNSAYVNPVFTYMHGVGVDSGCAITGGTFFNPSATNYPAAYLDKYYYIDYCGNWINMITTTGQPVWSNFASNIANYPVDMVTGPDGNLYFLSRNNQALYKITYSSSAVPLIVNQPQSQTISLNYPVTFSATASGALPLAYQWWYGGAPISGATGSNYSIPAVAYSDSGNYYVVVTNTSGSTTSNNAHLTVTSNQPPIASIQLPLNNSLYAAGDIINFSGSATDPEDGNLPASLFEWAVDFHHNTHIHPGPTAGSGISSGSFTIPNTGETSANVFYRLYLIVHDPDGAVDSAYVDIYPRTSTLIITTQPPGLMINLDGQPFTTPHNVLSVEGMARMISAPYSQVNGVNQVYFTEWSNGGPLTQSFFTPANDSTWTAYYSNSVLQYNLGNDTNLCTDDSIILDAGNNYSSYAWTDGSIGRYLSLESSVADTIKVGVTVTDQNGLAGNDSINVVFENCSSVGYLESSSIKIFPNPSWGELLINEVPENYFVNVTDLSGRIIIDNDFVAAHRTKHIYLQPGIYSMQLLSIEKHPIYRKRIVVVR